MFVLKFSNVISNTSAACRKYLVGLALCIRTYEHFLPPVAAVVTTGLYSHFTYNGLDIMVRLARGRGQLGCVHGTSSIIDLLKIN